MNEGSYPTLEDLFPSVENEVTRQDEKYVDALWQLLTDPSAMSLSTYLEAKADLMEAYISSSANATPIIKATMGAQILYLRGVSLRLLPLVPCITRYSDDTYVVDDSSEVLLQLLDLSSTVAEVVEDIHQQMTIWMIAYLYDLGYSEVTYSASSEVVYYVGYLNRLIAFKSVFQQSKHLQGVTDLYCPN